MVQIKKTDSNVNRYGELINSFEPAPLTDNSKVVLEKRYLLKDENDEVIETPNQMFIRVAKALAKPEKDYGLNETKAKQIENEGTDYFKLQLVPLGMSLQRQSARQSARQNQNQN